MFHDEMNYGLATADNRPLSQCVPVSGARISRKSFRVHNTRATRGERAVDEPMLESWKKKERIIKR